MTGMRELIETRFGGLKPSSVWVYLVPKASRLVGYLGDGMFAIEIGEADRIRDIDFRPLIGLSVAVTDKVGDVQRHRESCRLIAKANPSRLDMICRAADGWTVHTLEAGNTTTRHLSAEEGASLEAI